MKGFIKCLVVFAALTIVMSVAEEIGGLIGIDPTRLLAVIALGSVFFMVLDTPSMGEE